MQKLVSREHLPKLVSEIIEKKIVSFDTETTGLFWYDRPEAVRDVPFLLVVCDGQTAWLFDLYELNLISDKITIARIFSECEVLFAHNAKFDLHMMKNYFGEEWLGPRSTIHDTMVVQRLIDSDRMRFGLDAVASDFIGANKDKTVEQYIQANKLYSDLVIEGEKEKVLHYDRVPKEMINTYAAKDAVLTYLIGQKQIELINRCTTKPPLELERQTTIALWEMERRGVLLDVNYCRTQIEQIKNEIINVEHEFKLLTGELEFIDSRKQWDRILGAMGVVAPKTEKGNSSYDEEFLASLKGNKVAELVLHHRNLNKKITTYFLNYLYYRSVNEKIHANFKQHGAASGRFSASAPNLQNVPRDDDEGAISIRRSFIPQKDFNWLSIDYSQLEYRVMLDLAARYNQLATGKRGLPMIDEITQGMDIHQATANMVGISRQHAKNVNFACLYGAGPKKIGEMTGMSTDAARTMLDKYFAALPEVRAFIRAVIRKCEMKGFIQGRTGRIWRLPRDFAYKAPNYLIQGTCSDIMRKAMVDCHEHLKPFKSHIVLTIHDELNFYVHKSEMFLVNDLINIMQKAYDHTYLPLTCSVEMSENSWKDIAEWK